MDLPQPNSMARAEYSPILPFLGAGRKMLVGIQISGMKNRNRKIEMIAKLQSDAVRAGGLKGLLKRKSTLVRSFSRTCESESERWSCTEVMQM